METSETSESDASAGATLQIQPLKISLAISELWDELLEGKISLEEFEELKRELQEGMVEGRKRRKRR